MKVGMFPSLRLHQDTVLCIKLAANFKLCPGEIKKPVAMRRLHANNRITNPQINFNNTRFLMFDDLKQWLEGRDVEEYKKRLVIKRYHRYKYLMDRGNKKYLSAFWHLVYWRLMFRENEEQYLEPGDSHF